MSINLTTSIPIPNVGRLRVTRVNLDTDNNVGEVFVESGTAGSVYQVFRLQIRDGQCDKVQKNANSGSHLDKLQVATAAIASAYTNLTAAWLGAGGIPARLRAVETQALADGWVDATLTGTVQ